MDPARRSSCAVSISSTATASDLPGPGRGIGKLYSKGGRILERAISAIAHNLGFGPYAVSHRIMGLIPVDKSALVALGLFDPEIRAVINGLDRMLMYIECVSPHAVNCFC
jgi:hypothetical protein